jgi:hypothetical protein
MSDDNPTVDDVKAVVSPNQSTLFDFDLKTEGENVVLTGSNDLADAVTHDVLFKVTELATNETIMELKVSVTNDGLNEVLYTPPMFLMSSLIAMSGKGDEVAAAFNDIAKAAESE